MQKIAKQNIKIHGWINFLSWVVFLVPIISIFYKYTWLSIFEIVLISNIFTFWMRILELPTSVLADTTWRKKSLMFAVISNFICALIIVLYPTFIGFSIAAIFQALYYSFWSGTGQAFLQENLSILKEEKKFGKVIWSFMFYEQLAAIITPIISSLILKIFNDWWYTILAVLDALFALTLILLTTRLIETTEITEKFNNIRDAIKANLDTAKIAIKNVFTNKNLKLFLLYRSLSSHITFFGIILLPILSKKWMEDWLSWLITSIFMVWSMFASKYIYKFWEKYGYNYSWVISTVFQWLLLILAWLLFKNWIIVAVIYFLFSIFDWFIWPSRNHSLVELTKWKAIATTRSIIFAMFALYMTIGKQILSFVNIEYALIILWGIILLTNLFIGKKIIKIKSE